MSLPLYQDATPEHAAQMLAEVRPDMTCTDWLHHCGAECCTGFSIEDKGQNLKLQKIRYFGNAMPDMIRYYELHNCKYRMPYLYIPTKNAKRHNGRIYIMERCKALTAGGMCSLHNSGKPKVCRELTLDKIKEGRVYGGGQITPRCVFKYQLLKEANHEQREQQPG